METELVRVWRRQFIQTGCWLLWVCMETQQKAVGRTEEIQGCSQVSSSYYQL